MVLNRLIPNQFLLPFNMHEGVFNNAITLNDTDYDVWSQLM